MKKIMEWLEKNDGKIKYVMIALLCVAVVLCMIVNPDYMKTPEGYITMISLALTIVIFFLTEFLVEYRSKNRKTSIYREYLLMELDIKEKSKALSADSKKEQNKKQDKKVGIEGDDKDVYRNIIAQMIDNNDEIKEYFKISKRHAKSSYTFAIISCIIGIVILCFSVYSIFFVKNVELSIITIVSGAITEVIAGTVLWVHNKSALQLNHYYSALHENEKFLSAVNLVDKLSPEKRDDAYLEIIKKQIGLL